jgi:hypothetical protein
VSEPPATSTRQALLSPVGNITVVTVCCQAANSRVHVWLLLCRVSGYEWRAEVRYSTAWGGVASPSVICRCTRQLMLASDLQVFCVFLWMMDQYW